MALWEALGSTRIAPIWLQNRPQKGSKIDLGASWRALGAVLAAWGSLRGLLERFLEPLGASGNPPGALFKPPGALLELSWSQLGANIADLKGQRASKMEPKRVPHRAPNATGAQNVKITKVAHSTKDFIDFSGPGSSCREPKWLLERSWKHLESS